MDRHYTTTFTFSILNSPANLDDFQYLVLLYKTSSGVCVYIHSTDIYQRSAIKHQCRYLDYIFIDKIVKDPSFHEATI